MRIALRDMPVARDAREMPPRLFIDLAFEKLESFPDRRVIDHVLGIVDRKPQDLVPSFCDRPQGPRGTGNLPQESTIGLVPYR